MIGFKTLLIGAVVATFATTSAVASTKSQSTAKKPTDGWQLTLSPKPYTVDPNAAYEKNHCPPGSKNAKAATKRKATK